MLAVWAWFLASFNEAVEPSRKLVARLWPVLQSAARWVVANPFKMAVSMIASLQWDLVAAAFLAAWLARWLPGIEGEMPVVPREAVKPDEPVYILMVRGERLSKLMVMYESLRHLLITSSDETSSPNG